MVKNLSTSTRFWLRILLVSYQLLNVYMQALKSQSFNLSSKVRPESELTKRVAILLTSAPVGGGGTLIFLYIRRLGSFFLGPSRFKILNFHIYFFLGGGGGGSEK